MDQHDSMSHAWKRMELAQGDITRLACDAVVNAANTTLLGGGGVDGAIHRAAGPGLLAECRTIGGCPTGEARITRGYNLPCRYVIHTVGPVYRDGRHNEPEKLKSCYLNSLALAAENHIGSLAFPAISCGVYAYPIDEAARIALGSTAQFLSRHETPQRVVFVLYGSAELAIYQRINEELRQSV